TTAFVEGTPGRSQLVARYRLANTSERARDYTLALAVRPLQVNPPSQFLNTIGGVSPIHALSFADGVVTVDGKPRVFSLQAPDSAFASTLDSGVAVSRLLGAEQQPERMQVHDPQRHASGAMRYVVRLRPGEHHEVDLRIPMTGDTAGPGTDQHPGQTGEWYPQGLQDAVANDWVRRLDLVQVQVPEPGQALVDTLRTATAHMLISRIGPRLQPGTRSYARSWIRDGAMISEGLLRMGREDVVREYVDWYAPYQFENGKVPCCVDDRGSDPVPENDSHGELIFSIAELYRYDGDRAFLGKMWPHVLGAYTYMEQLRLSERNEANRAVNPAFYGMMPASISHEGYSAKPMHSYWDNFWSLRGYKDAVEVAQWLGKTEDAERMAASRDQFRDDLYDSLRAAAKLHGINFLPGAAELGDFDPTSTTIALAPGGEQGRLPQDLLINTFERYWAEFVQRRDGQRKWKDYTPYEWRNVGAFVRLGWRERAWEAVDYFFNDRVPQPWNQWGEVVSSTPRKPFFLGDLPHAWVGSDFVRSALDMFAYVREIDDSIVLAAGIPVDWLDEGIAIRDLRTPRGKLGYALRREDGVLQLDVASGLDLPAGGLVLPWPYQTAPGKATVNGEPVQWSDQELRIHTLPAQVRIGPL
ncbi:MAG: coagulation factor 5/8 type domain-containing protein, partial [Pseudoxanthomonas sp.]|nr:coagulation factor 5/8 type domain-containing protein [Pseudoxanthomonas sp.]